MYDVIGDADTFSLVSGVYENNTADIGKIDDVRRRKEKKSAEDLRKISLRGIIMIIINICIICISVWQFLWVCQRRDKLLNLRLCNKPLNYCHSSPGMIKQSRHTEVILEICLYMIYCLSSMIQSLNTSGWSQYSVFRKMEDESPLTCLTSCTHSYSKS